jgi:STE24 endopeptidase
VLLAALLATGASAWLRDIAAAATRRSGSSPATIALYVGILCAAWHLLALPVAWYGGLVVDRRYGLSSESAGRWLRDYLKGALLSTVIALLAAEFLYLTLRRWPRAWWAIAALGCGFGILLLTRAAPVVLLPLFYRFTPLDRPSLLARLEALCVRAGLRAVRVDEWKVGDRTPRANAALVGVGGTRRILLSDTLLAACSDEEIEVVLAHELAHHAHRDVLKGVAAQTLLLVAAFGAAAAALHAAPRIAPGTATSGPSDVALLPLLLLAAGAASMLLAPAMNAMSRAHERRADAYALRLTQQPAAFISAMRRLAAQNLAEPQPGRLALWLFHSHPPVEERVERAKGFR